LAAAYNGGPGNLSKWKRLQDQRGETREDALLFIESLPAAETRQFITRLLYSYWMYSERLGQATPSLDQLAQGEWPMYAAPARAARAVPPPQTAQR
jgi:soluble lytic murein transglycosylase-like protein